MSKPKPKSKPQLRFERNAAIERTVVPIHHCPAAACPRRAVVPKLEMKRSGSGHRRVRIDGRRRHRMHLPPTRRFGMRDLALAGDDMPVLTGPAARCAGTTRRGMRRGHAFLTSAIGKRLTIIRLNGSPDGQAWGIRPP
jgi:hypothetical protein